MANKIDGVIESARYKNGQIAAVRVYERRGAVFSDRLLFDRRTLLGRLQKGNQFVIGSRKDLMAGTFTVSKPVFLVAAEDREYIATRKNTARDDLEDTPFF